MSKLAELDETDRQIIAILMRDARTPFTEIAKQIDMSSGTIHVRMKKLEEKGVVLGAHLQVDYAQLGYDVVAFLGIFLDKSDNYDDVAIALKAIPEIVSANYTTGSYNIFAKIVCRDTSHLRDVLHDKIQKVRGIQRTETFISLEEGINRPVQFDF
ncbi:MAG: hypothetical protein RI894_797 [Bacteroidota bacterium]|jgi:Lrp/AsnC family transcriptional regulator for asnA, asnC and gidA